MAKLPKLTRAQRRDRRSSVPSAGVFGVDVKDAGADSWRGRYVVYAESPDQAKSRIHRAGFHTRQIEAEWRPGQEPPEGLPSGLGPGNEHWYRRRLNDSGWTAWEQLPGDYRHPPQGQAAVDPSVR